MQILRKTIMVTETDLDDLNHVNNVRYVVWVQDMAKTHWLTKATQDMQDQYYWILLSHRIDYKHPAFLNDELLLETYVSKSEGVTSTRHVRFKHLKDDRILAESETTWCLISRKSHKPSRIPQEITALFN